MRAKTSLGLMAILLFAVSAEQAKAEPVALSSSGSSSLQLLEHVGYAIGGTTSGSATSGTSSLSSETNAGTSNLPSGVDGTSESGGTVSLPSATLPGTDGQLPGSSGTGGTGGTPTQDNSVVDTGGQLPPGTVVEVPGGDTLNSDAALPEPSTLGLVACLAGVGVVVWRAKRQKSKAGRR